MESVRATTYSVTYNGGSLYLVHGVEFICKRDANIIFHGCEVGGMASGFGYDAALDAGSGETGKIKMSAGLGRELAQAGPADGCPVGRIKIILVHFQQAGLTAGHEAGDDDGDAAVLELRVFQQAADVFHP